jgi:hypothetical protein
MDGFLRDYFAALGPVIVGLSADVTEQGHSLPCSAARAMYDPHRKDRREVFHTTFAASTDRLDDSRPSRVIEKFYVTTSQASWAMDPGPAASTRFARPQVSSQ